MTIKLTADQRDLITMLAGWAAGSEEKLTALPYHIEWVLNLKSNDAKPFVYSDVKFASDKDVWNIVNTTAKSIGPFSSTEDRDNRVEALRQAISATEKFDIEDGVLHTAQAFYEFLSGCGQP